MLTLEDALAAMLGRITPCTDIETVALDAADGRYLAGALHARVDNPAFDNSAMDGYALNSVDLAGRDPPVLPVAGEAACGSAPATLPPGTTLRIFTGAPLPHGADTVVMQEDVRRANDRVEFPAPVRPEQHIRRRGEDFRAGDVLTQPGRRLTAFDLALLAAAGVGEVAVWRRARVCVIATGDELVAPGAALAPGQIYESNRLATLALVRALGAEAIDGGTLADRPAALRDRLAQAGAYDFVVTSGGASVGDHDLVRQVFAEIGEVHFWKARIKPGKPIAFGRVGARSHFFALPGNPVSSLVTFKLFVEPALIAWSHGRPGRLMLKAVAAGAFRRRAGRMEFLRARLFTRDGELYARALPGQGSHMLAPLAATNGFIVVPADSDGYADGATVQAMPLTLVLE